MSKISQIEILEYIPWPSIVNILRIIGTNVPILDMHQEVKMSKSLYVIKVAWNAHINRIINSINLVLLAPVKKDESCHPTLIYILSRI